MYIFIFIFKLAFLALASMLIYGLDYSPLFTSLAVDTSLGYIIGTLYAWMLTAVILVQTFECPSSLVSATITSTSTDFSLSNASATSLEVTDTHQIG